MKEQDVFRLSGGLARLGWAAVSQIETTRTTAAATHIWTRRFIPVVRDAAIRPPWVTAGNNARRHTRELAVPTSKMR